MDYAKGRVTDSARYDNIEHTISTFSSLHLTGAHPLRQQGSRDPMIRTRMQKVTQFLFTAALAIASFQAQAEVRIMAVGDSITAGFTFGPPDGTGLGTASYRKEFENLLDQSGCDYRMVGSRNTNDPENPTVFIGRHEGYSANRADHFILGNGPNAGIDAMMAAQSPDVVMLHLGSNDMNQSQTQRSTVLEIENIISRILSANGNAIILVANVIPWFGSSNNPDITDDIRRLGNQIISSVAAMGNPNVILVDVRSGFSQSDMQQDLIHPNVDGENRIADAFAEAFENSGVCAQFDVIDPATFISTPSAGGSVSTNASFSGTATDAGGAGINRVQIAIERISDDPTIDSEWLHFEGANEGGFGPISINGVDVGITNTNLTNTSLTSANWNFSTTLPAGNNYRVYVLAVDNAGNDAFHGNGLEVWPVNHGFTVNSPDNTDPSAAITSPGVSSTIAPANRNVTGTSFDADSGVDNVRVQIQRLDTSPRQYWNGSVWTTAAGFVDASVSANGSTWSLANVDLTNPGSYRVRLRAEDNASNLFTGPFTRFTVAAADSTNPGAVITSPAVASTIAPANTNVTGTSFDADSGVDSVRVQIQRLDTSPRQYWNGSAWTNAAGFVDASVSANGSTWSLANVDLTNPGSYRVRLRAEDNASNLFTGPFTRFTVAAADSTNPSASVTTPGSSISAANTDVTGSAFDADSGVDRVRVQIQKIDSIPRLYWNGSAWTTAAGFTEAVVSPNGAAWTLPNVDLTNPGSYRIRLRAHDNAGNVFTGTFSNFTVF